MLKLKQITKNYLSGNEKVEALKGIDIEFRKSEFVSILGQSGSGKTTLLNIIGGLDRYTSGDLIINGKSTKDFKDRDLDSYRNYSVGFIFQSYNLISHQTVLENVELALTISGYSQKEKKKKAIEALKNVGLGDKIYYKPNQLSGGQMQRVAIARAIVNNPDIILADEPTGALDTKTSIQIMDQLKEIAKDKLIIMVTHNPDLAEKYSTRIVRIVDGKITDDSNPYKEETIIKKEKNDNKKKSNKREKQRRTKMKWSTALKLSLNNLMTKKGRTILTSFAGSIGIIGIALVLSLSNGINNYTNDIQKKTMLSYPIEIDAESFDLSSLLNSASSERKNKLSTSNEESQHDLDSVYSDVSSIERAKDISSSSSKNNLTEFKKYLDDENSEIRKYIGENGIVYSYDTEFSIYSYDENGEKVNADGSTFSTNKYEMTYPMQEVQAMSSDNSITPNSFSQLIYSNNEISSAIKNSYNLVYGKYPENYDEVVLVMDYDNEISTTTLYDLGLLPSKDYREIIDKINNNKDIEINTSKISYEDICNHTFKLIPKCDYFEEISNGIYTYVGNNENKVNSLIDNGIELKITGIIKPNDDDVTLISGNIGYTEKLTDYLINYTDNSNVVKAQEENKDKNILTGQKFEGTTYDDNLKLFGKASKDSPSAIEIYVDTFENKDKIKECIENYNNKASEENKITYTDYIQILVTSVNSIINTISYVLIAFVSISLVVSSIMIAIITYISVLERTKEIGILRAMGTSKRDVSKIFNAETLIEGFFSGLLGVIITILLNIPISHLIQKITEAEVTAVLSLNGAIILILISVFLTFIAGLIPSKMAAKKDPAVVLRSE